MKIATKRAVTAATALLLAAGTYTQGLPIHNKHGQAGKCIVFEGPASGSPALFTGSDSWNVISLKDSSYIAVRNLSLNGQDKLGDAVKAEATAVSVQLTAEPDVTLTIVDDGRGFDPATQRYRYEVNQRFGSTSPSGSAFRTPVTLTAMFRFDLGPMRERQLPTEFVMITGMPYVCCHARARWSASTTVRPTTC